MTDVPAVAERQEICPFTLYPPFLTIATFFNYSPSIYELLVSHGDLLDSLKGSVFVLFAGFAPNKLTQKRLKVRGWHGL